MSPQLLTDAELDQRLRQTLRAVAATVEGESSAAPRRRRRPGRRTVVALGAAVVTLPLAAAAIIGIGPEYVDELPPDHVVVAGSVDGNRYWMVEAFHKNECGQPEPGVELVVEHSNLVGREWNTLGLSYGEPRMSGGSPDAGWCGYDVSAALADPALSYAGGTFVGDTFVRVMAVHPDVTAVRLSVREVTEDITVHPVDGAGYAAVEVPADSAAYTVELLVDGEVVPGSRQRLHVPVHR